MTEWQVVWVPDPDRWGALPMEGVLGVQDLPAAVARIGLRPGDPVFVAPDGTVDPELLEFVLSGSFRYLERSRKAGTPVNLAPPSATSSTTPTPAPTAGSTKVTSRTSAWSSVPARPWKTPASGPPPGPSGCGSWNRLGETGNWSPRHYPYRLLAHQIRVIEETDPHQALGDRGRDVLDVIHHQIPELAAWRAADWTADPDGMSQRLWTWETCASLTSGSGQWAQSVAGSVSHSRREAAAQTWIEGLARNTVDQVLAHTGLDVSHGVRHYAYTRAVGQAVAAQHQHRFDPYVLDALRGVDLDAPAPAAV